jgi:hypothetical protein
LRDGYLDGNLHLDRSRGRRGRSLWLWGRCRLRLGFRGRLRFASKLAENLPTGAVAYRQVGGDVEE